MMYKKRDKKKKKTEISHLSLGQQRLDDGPCLTLSSIAQQVHDDGAAFNRLLDLKEVFTGNPAILDSLFPRSAVLAHTNDNVEAVVAEVQALAVALGAVPDESESLVFEEFLELVKSTFLYSHIAMKKAAAAAVLHSRASTLRN